MIGNIGLVIVSPLRRALETCHYLFLNDNNKKIKVIVDPIFTE